MVGQPGGPVLRDPNGPEWLTAWLINPPPWVPSATKLIGLVVAAVVAYRLYQRDFRVSVDQQREMQIVVAHVLAIMLATAVVVEYGGLGFAASVVTGFGIGYGVGLAAQWAGRRVPVPAVIAAPRDRVTAVWAGLLAVGMVLPAAAGVGGQSAVIATGRWLLVGAAALMVMYNAIEEQREPNSAKR